MFPLIAIGAALLGGFTVKEAIDASDPSGASSRMKGSAAPASHPEQTPQPQQSYLVTPVSGGADSSGRPLTALEAVRNFVF